MAIDNIARGMAASNSGSGGGGINADIVKGVGIDFEGTDPITIKNTGVTSVSESSTNGTINVSNGGKTPVEVPVHGLGSAAYKNENDFLSSDVKYASSDSVGGSANSAKKLANTEAIGSSTNAVYFNENGIPVACTYEVNEDVPSGAKFTDTTYTISTGDSSGEIKITSSDGDEYSVKVKDLNNAAYKDVADSIAENNEGLVTSGLTYTELNKKVDKASVTNSVETGNTNPVTSGAVYSALTKKADKTIFDVENAGLTPKSTNVNAYLKGDGSWSVPDNTTYTISEGSSNGTIKVTSSDEPNKPVSVPVHGLGSAAYKNVDTSVAENSENLITSGAVSQAINELPNPMLFKGSLGTSGTITYLPTATPENEGYTYKVITAGSYSGKTAKVGDVFISNGSEWIIVPSGDEPNGTVTSVGMSVPTGLKIKGGTSPVTTSGTIEVLLDDGYVIPKEADIVPSTRKINNITLESDVILDGDDIKATGYVKAESKSDIVGTDTINQAVGKLEYKVDTNETNISTLVQGLDTTNENVTTLTNDLAQVTQDVSNITSALNLYPENIAGVCVDYENKKYTRLSGAIGKTHGSDFDSFPVYSSMRRCNLADDGTVNAYYGDDTYVEDGSNGQVMVEIKKVYYKMNPVKLEKASSGYGYHVRKADYFVSHQQLPGFKLHPAFIVDGVEKDAIYMSAYEGSLYDTSASAYIMDDAQVADFSADKLCSIANAKPISGSSQALDRPNIEKLSTNRGAGWHVETVQMRSLIQLLMLIEYAGNIQTLLGRGIVDISDNSSYNCSSLNGSTSSLGNRSGMAASTIITKGTEQTTETANGKVAVSYRGIENPYGNIWKLVEGITMYGNGAMAGGMPYICDSTTFTENTTTGYTPAGFVVPKEGYISAFGYANEDLDWLFVASETNGSDSLPMGDYTYITKDLNGYHGGFIGGNWSSLSLAGCFFWRLNHSASRRNRAIGGRLCKI